MKVAQVISDFGYLASVRLGLRCAVLMRDSVAEQDHRAPKQNLFRVAAQFEF